jgi:hypothetical protein
MQEGFFFVLTLKQSLLDLFNALYFNFYTDRIVFENHNFSKVNTWIFCTPCCPLFLRELPLTSG